MIWLLFSIACSTLIFIVFKLFARYQVDNLQAIVVNYFVAFGVGLITAAPGFELTEIPTKPWLWSVVILGTIFIAMFQLIALVSQKFGVAAVSVAVKMSLVIPVVFAISYYGESFTWLKLAGIVLALAAVFFATRKPAKTRGHISLIFLPLILFLGSGFLDLFLKYNQQELVAPADQGFFASLIFLMAGILGVIWFVVAWLLGKNRPQARSLIGGLALGIPNYGSIYFLIKALDIENLESSVVFPINNVGIVALSVICGCFLFNENLSPINKLGIILALISIGLMTFSNFF